nr:MAG TPA: hypothetical protein [Caudoviricetes sp.]
MICFNADARHAGKLVSTVLSLRAAARSQAVTIAALWSLCISNKKTDCTPFRRMRAYNAH